MENTDSVYDVPLKVCQLPTFMEPTTTSIEVSNENGEECCSTYEEMDEVVENKHSSPITIIENDVIRFTAEPIRDEDQQEKSVTNQVHNSLT